MKKLLLSLITLTLIYGCSEEVSKKTPATFNTDILEMNYEDKKQLIVINAYGGIKWASKDEFVATVDSGGFVIAEHIGNTLITATVGAEYLVCEVSVLPTQFLYTDPILEFGQSKEYIKSNETRPLGAETNITIKYQDLGVDCNTRITYFFENNKLFSVAVTITNATAAAKENLIVFLSERYQIDSIYEYPTITRLELKKGNMIIDMETTHGGCLVKYRLSDENDF